MINFDGYKWYKFWLKSNRGTDTNSYKFLPGAMDDGDIKDELEQWCSRTAAWTQSQCQYGYEDIVKPPKDILAKKISRLKVNIQHNRVLLSVYETQQLQEIVE